MSGVTMSSGVSSILLSLQTTAASMSATQNHLATGRKVISALDNPRNFFTSLSLRNRANDLHALLDNIGKAQSTLTAANNGINALVKLVQSAKSLAQQARLAPLPQSTYSAIEQTGSTDVSAENAGSVTGNVNVTGGFLADADGLQIQVGASTYTVHPASSPTTVGINAIIASINSTPGLGTTGAVTASLDNTGTYIKLTANSTDTSFSVLPSAAATALGIGSQTGTSTNLLQAVGGLSGTSLTVQAAGWGPKTITFGTVGAQVSTLAELQSALDGYGVSAGLNGNNLSLTVAGSSSAQNSLTTNGTALAALGLPAAGTVYGAVNAPTPNAVRTSAQAQYNALLQQIDSLAGDSSYNGVNLLGGDSLNAAFNENGSSALTIAGVSLNSGGLNLSALPGSDFQSNAAIDNVMDSLDGALAILRTQASTFGSNLTTLQARQDFTKNLIDTLQSGADGLVLADTNEEGANLLALQTRLGLSLTALSVSAQSDQAILKLFR
jgi:flagellin-like hook-associated protein FlgL